MRLNQDSRQSVLCMALSAINRRNRGYSRKRLDPRCFQMPFVEVLAHLSGFFFNLRLFGRSEQFREDCSNRLRVATVRRG